MNNFSNVVARAAIGGCAALALSLSARPCVAEEPTLSSVETDPGAIPPPGTGTRLMWTGAALSVGWYGVALGSSYLWDDAEVSRDWRVPVAGPWMALRQVKCGPDEARCGTPIVVLRTALTLISSVGQLGGLLAFGEGLLLDFAPPKRASVPSDTASVQWLPLPLANPNALGLEILGTF